MKHSLSRDSMPLQLEAELLKGLVIKFERLETWNQQDNHDLNMFLIII